MHEDLMEEARAVSDNHYSFCTPACPRGDHDHDPSLTTRLVTALESQAAEVQQLRDVIEQLNVRIDQPIHPDNVKPLPMTRGRRIFASAPVALPETGGTK